MEIDLGEIPFGLDFHPYDNLVATALITGDLHIYRYGADSTSQKLQVKAHTESCRTVRFINGGQAIITGSSDCSIRTTNAETGQEIARLENSHAAPIYSMINLTELTFATGDDQGCIKVWDIRIQQNSCTNSCSYIAHKDNVSDMTCVSDSSKLLGTRFVYFSLVCFLLEDWRYLFISVIICTVQTVHEFKEELLSVVVMKNGQMVICGSQAGTLELVAPKVSSDRFLGLSPNSIDSMVKLDEDRLIAGCENGVISLVGILPNRVIQPLAEHSEYPIERLAFSHDRKFLGSISHDTILKLWDMNDLLQSVEMKNDGVEQLGDAFEDGSEEMMDLDMNPPKKGSLRKNEQNISSTKTSFFASM
ncbi:WD repeat-containing protein 55 [Linum perenne]